MSQTIVTMPRSVSEPVFSDLWLGEQVLTSCLAALNIRDTVESCCYQDSVSRDVASQKHMLYPRPQRKECCQSSRVGSAHQNNSTRSSLTKSLQAGSCQDFTGQLELKEIFQNPSETAPTGNFLGVSPPVRSGFCGGAANPLGHDPSWLYSAYSASHTNLQALRELDSTAGVAFLRAGKSGDQKLLLGSPEAGSLSEAADWSDTDSTGQVEYTPFSCRTEYFAV